MKQIAQSIEEILPGVCEEEISEEINRLEAESDSLLQRAEEIDRRLTSLKL